MPYLTREDGVHFVIPSYREVLIAKNNNALQKDVIALSQSYGEYITMQRKDTQKYEIAFSPDTGYLLGETVWHHFSKPDDLIYCEAIPNTTEAILVIVKGGSVYLDGSFPAESIPEELVIFLTQQNNFEVYIYGDVPISEKPAEGKFSFDTASIKLFTVLDEPVFKNLPLIKAYQFRLMDAVLKDHGIGVFPIRQLVMTLGAIGAIILAYVFITSTKEPPPEGMIEPNPLQAYVDQLNSPAPDHLMAAVTDAIKLLYTAPGWQIKSVQYQSGSLTAMMQSPGTSIKSLTDWGAQHHALTVISPAGVILAVSLDAKMRPKPKLIYPNREILTIFIDNLSKVFPGNNMSLSMTKGAGPFSVATITINVKDATPLLIGMIGETFKDLPITLEGVDLSMRGELLYGTITINALGS